MARTQIDPEVRAKAIADLAAGEQPAVVAERYGLKPVQVRVWKQRYVTADSFVTPVSSGDTPIVTGDRSPPNGIERQKLRIGSLVIDLLAAKLKASQAIADAVSDPIWIRKQPASELAALGAWLDATAFAIGDRLAASAAPEDPDPTAD